MKGKAPKYHHRGAGAGYVAASAGSRPSSTTERVPVRLLQHLAQIQLAVGLIDEGQGEGADEIRRLMSGNICQLRRYSNIVAAVQQGDGTAMDDQVMINSNNARPTNVAGRGADDRPPIRGAKFIAGGPPPPKN